MATPTDICNIALRRIGADRISDLATDASKNGKVARDLYDEARRDLLNVHTWNFAKRRLRLTVSETEPTFGWDYAYPLPDDFIRMVGVHPHDDDDASVPYKLEFQEGDDRVLVTNSNQIYISYIFDVEDCNIMSASFRDVLAWRLASDFASAIAQSTTQSEYCDTRYRRALARSKSIDGIEDFPDKMADGSWLTARFPDTSRG